MTQEERDNLIGLIAEAHTNNASEEELRDLFQQNQVEHLDECEDEELEALAEELGL